ncbi:MAG: macro domain-containing protein [Pirellulales bacterium]
MLRLRYGEVELVLGNIVQQETDAIVNAANTRLAGGGGVDGAIHRAAGPELKRLCEQFPADESGRRCRTGEVKVTTGGRLRAAYVLHAVGPFFQERHADRARSQLRQLHEKILEAAREHGCRSIAIPAISTGAYRFPLADAAAVAVDTVCAALETVPGSVRVRFVLFKERPFEIYSAALAQWQHRRTQPASPDSPLADEAGREASG